MEDSVCSRTRSARADRQAPHKARMMAHSPRHPESGRTASSLESVSRWPAATLSDLSHTVGRRHAASSHDPPASFDSRVACSRRAWLAAAGVVAGGANGRRRRRRAAGDRQSAGRLARRSNCSSRRASTTRSASVRDCGWCAVPKPWRATSGASRCRSWSCCCKAARAVAWPVARPSANRRCTPGFASDARRRLLNTATIGCWCTRWCIWPCPACRGRSAGCTKASPPMSNRWRVRAPAWSMPAKCGAAGCGGCRSGQPQPGDRGLDQTLTWGRVYWGGAMFCLLADVRTRQRDPACRGLQQALQGVLQANGDYRVAWPVQRILATGDAALGQTTLSDLYSDLKDSTHGDRPGNAVARARRRR